MRQLLHVRAARQLREQLLEPLLEGDALREEEAVDPRPHDPLRRHHHRREAEREEDLPVSGCEPEGVAGRKRGRRHHAEHERHAEDRQHAVR